MPYNFETTGGDVYVGSTLVPGLGYLDSTLGGIYTGAVFDPTSSYYVAKPFTGFATDVGATFSGIGQKISNTIDAGNTLTTGLGVLSGSLGLVIFAGGAYLLAKNQRWIK